MTPEDNQAETTTFNPPDATESKEFERVEKITRFKTNNFGDWKMTRLLLPLRLIN